MAANMILVWANDQDGWNSRTTCSAFCSTVLFFQFHGHAKFLSASVVSSTPVSGSRMNGSSMAWTTRGILWHEHQVSLTQASFAYLGQALQSRFCVDVARVGPHRVVSPNQLESLVTHLHETSHLFQQCLSLAQMCSIWHVLPLSILLRSVLCLPYY